MSKNIAVILAGGEGKRMKSNKPKVLAEVLFKPMIDWVLAAAKASGVEETVLVVGHLGELVEEHAADRAKVVWQRERLGTGHAVMQALDILKASDADNVLILNGDAPFMDTDTILGSLHEHEADGNAVTVISAEIAEPHGYGRILRAADGSLSAIVEEKDASDDQRRIHEVNSGGLWFRREDLIHALGQLTTGNEAHEYYLTDTIGILKAEGKRAGASATANANVVLGANDRWQLHQLNEIARMDILKKHMVNGVSIPCIDGVIIGKDVEIGNETEILPGTILRGKVTVGSNCVLGPNTQVNDSVIEDNVVLNNVECEESFIGEGCDLGPFTHVRPNSRLTKNVHAGNFVEIKNAVIGEGTKVPHLTYVGDSDVGKGCNFGCGSLTVNYDGKIKHRTKIGDYVFVGCNTNLVAPVELGDFAYTAAGSTITESVPAESMAIARARQVNKEGWVSKKQPYKNKNPEKKD